MTFYPKPLSPNCNKNCDKLSYLVKYVHPNTWFQTDWHVFSVFVGYLPWVPGVPKCANRYPNGCSTQNHCKLGVTKNVTSCPTQSNMSTQIRDFKLIGTSFQSWLGPRGTKNNLKFAHWCSKALNPKAGLHSNRAEWTFLVQQVTYNKLPI